MKIFVTGATGYLGRELALHLAYRGDNVHVLVRDPMSPRVPIHQRIKVFEGDITEGATLKASLMGCDQVFHVAALVRPWTKDSSMFYKVNVEGTRNLLAEALERGVGKFVFTSSCGVLWPSINIPISGTSSRCTGWDNDYEFSKLLAENLVREYYHQYNLQTVIVSPTKIFGRGFDTRPIGINKAIRKFLAGKINFIPKPGSLISKYCFIDDVIEGHLLTMQKGTAGEKYILGGENISYTDLFDKLRRISGLKSWVVPVPRPLVQFAAHLQHLASRIISTEPYVSPASVNLFYQNKAIAVIRQHVNLDTCQLLLIKAL